VIGPTPAEGRVVIEEPDLGLVLVMHPASQGFKAEHELLVLHPLMMVYIGEEETA